MSSNFDKIKETLSNEKRKCDRLQVPLKIRYIKSSDLEGGSTGWLDYVLLNNIGGEGIGFSDDVEFVKGEKLEIDLLLLEETDRMTFGVEIVWISQNFAPDASEDVKKFSYGFKIIRLDAEDRKKLERFISDTIIDEYLDDHGDLKNV